MLSIFSRSSSSTKSFFNTAVKGLLILKKVLVIFLLFSIRNFILILLLNTISLCLYVIQLTISLITLKFLNKKYFPQSLLLQHIPKNSLFYMYFLFCFHVLTLIYYYYIFNLQFLIKFLITIPLLHSLNLIITCYFKILIHHSVQLINYYTVSNKFNFHD